MTPNLIIKPRRVSEYRQNYFDAASRDEFGGQYAPSPDTTARGVRIRILTSSQGDHVLAYFKSRRTMSSNFTRLRPFTCHRPVIPGFASSKRRLCQKPYAF